MRTIKWSEYLTGDDSTGDGTSGNPYKTITQASIGLTGGDEVRVGKGPADAALTGTLGFTINGTALVGTGTLFTSELVIGDFVKGGDGHWWEVITITSDVAATLYKRYAGDTESGISSFKLGVISTGEAAAAATAVQTVSVAGTSVLSRLKISGGWDLTTELQTGESFFRQMHGTFGTRYGRGLYISGKNYLEIEKLSFLRYDNGLYISSCDWCLITGMVCSSAGDEGFMVQYLDHTEFVSCTANACFDKCMDVQGSRMCTFTDTTVCSGGSYGLKLATTYFCTFIRTVIKSSSVYGMYMATSFYNEFRTVTANRQGAHGLSLRLVTSNKFSNVTCNYNDKGMRVSGCYGITCQGFSATGNTTAEIEMYQGELGSVAGISIQDYGAAGDNRQIFYNGISYRDTANARSGACLKLVPTSAVLYIRQAFFCPVSSGVARTVKLYMKDDVAFNGDVRAALFFLGDRITGWSTWTMTTDYVEQSIVGALGDITEDGVLELRVEVRGTAGDVFADDFSYS